MNDDGSIFPTFFMAGFECSTFVWKDQERKDYVAATGHDRHMEADLAAAMHLGIGHVGAVHPHGDAVARREVEHVALPQQALGALLVEDGARIDLGGDLEGDARRHVGLDEAGDHVHRRALRREDQMDPARARILREPRDQLLDLLARHHHQVR